MEAPKEVESEVIDVDDILESQKKPCLLGRLLSTRQWNPSNLIEVIKKDWKPKHGMSWRVSDESKLILFCFEDVMDRDWVLKNQPWHFKGHLFAISKFTVENELQPLSLVNITIVHASFWARLYDVPLSCMNERPISLFAKQIGILESVDTSGEDLFGKFIRFKVSMNITKPLLRGITVRVKGKHLWLPLNYESLPIFCFSCGIIGHGHKTCQSFNPNLKYSSLKLSAFTAYEKIEEVLPHDIVENILLRLPVKCLVRFRMVCKMWETKISDPGFAEAHLQRCKNSTSRNLLGCKVKIPGPGFVSTHSPSHVGQCDHTEFLVAQLVESKLKFVSAIEPSWKCPLMSGGILGSCDGLYLIRCLPRHGEVNEVNMCLLWNPSCRAYREIWYPQPLENHGRRYGIYYNPLMKDYKVVIGDWNHYAVFSCRYNKWSEVKETEGFSSGRKIKFGKGVSINGSVYWLHSSSTVGSRDFKHEIVYFDWKDEKFKKVPTPDCKGTDCTVGLTSWGGNLCLWHTPRRNELRIMRKDDMDSWMEFKVQLQLNLYERTILRRLHTLCWLSEDEIILLYRCCNSNNDRIYIIYDLSKNTSTRIHIAPYLDFNEPLPYLENLFLQ